MNKEAINGDGTVVPDARINKEKRTTPMTPTTQVTPSAVQMTQAAVQMTQATREFVRQHRTDDVRTLALKGGCDDMTFALEQIRGWQAARRKLPSWAAVEGIIYPPHLSMEQCSSEQTARYKGELARRLTAEISDETVGFADLTGGFGIDCFFISRALQEVHEDCRCQYVEQQPHLCELARQNFATLSASSTQGKGAIDVKNADSIEFLQAMEPVTLLFLDPARRDSQGGRVFGIEDCQPDVSAWCDELVRKSRFVLVKLSPMLDWHAAVAALRYVREVHIVAVAGECKELLVVLSREGTDEHLRVCCIDDDSEFSFDAADNEAPAAIGCSAPQLGDWLYEPNAAVMKAGGFGRLAARFGVQPIAPNSHLFVASRRVDGFPGRQFQVQAVSSLGKREVARQLQGIDRANITVRNFPMTVAALRKRLKLGDGGDHYLFATTCSDGRHVLIIAKKAP